METRSSAKRALSVLICLVLVLSVLFAFPKEAQAGTYFKKITSESTVKNGTYYFKLKNGNVYYSKSKSSGFKKAGFKGTVSSAFSDGATIYATEKRSGENYARLSAFSLSKKTLKKLSRLSLSSSTGYAPGWTISAVYGKTIYLTRSSFEEWRLKTYIFNTSTGTLKWKKNNCTIESRYKQYALARNEYKSDVSPSKWGLYKVSSNGDIQFLKTLGTSISSAKFAGGKIYYGKYTSKDMNKVTIYRCETNGSGVKNLGTISFSSSSYDMVMPYGFTSTYCKVYHDGKEYKYTYSTKKLTKL